jgi:hypothetical protein
MRNRIRRKKRRKGRIRRKKGDEEHKTHERIFLLKIFFYTQRNENKTNRKKQWSKVIDFV